MQHTDSADTQHEYFADRPGFPAKTIVATLFIGAFFGYLNDTLLNVALTPIMRDFHIDKTTAQWLTTGFLLVMGAFTPITAGVIQWFETRRMVLITQATFLAGSLICALAPNFGVLLAGRWCRPYPPPSSCRCCSTASSTSSRPTGAARPWV